MKRSYKIPDDREGPLTSVEEWNDSQLTDEFEFLSRLLSNVANEIAFRAEHPEAQDNGEIGASEAELTELVEQIENYRSQYLPKVSNQ